MTSDLSAIQRRSSKENFIDSLLHAGEMRLQEGNPSGLELLQTAADLCPDSSKLFYRQGLAIFDYACSYDQKALNLAAQKFKRAADLTPESFESWLSWANCLLLLGNKTSEYHYFLKAKKIFEKALELTNETIPEEFLLDLYWNYGLCIGRIAMHSEDPLDLQLGYRSFEKASLLKEEKPLNFWCDYGHLSIRLYEALGDHSYLFTAIKHFKQAVKLSQLEHYPWIHLGDALTSLYCSTREKEYFEQASECYGAGSTLKSKDPSIWLKWATLLMLYGREASDTKSLHVAIEKCHKARSMGANPTELTCIWAEALAALGSIKNRLKNLRRAEEMLDDLLDSDDQDPQIHFSYGQVLLALGDYFNCFDLFCRATEAFQRATSLNRTFHSAWHALGTCYMILTPLEEDSALQLERAVRFFSKAINIRPCAGYHHDLGHALYLLADEKSSKKLLDRGLHHIETALDLQNNSAYACIDWIHTYASALALSGQLNELESHFSQSLDHLHHILTVEPTYPSLNYRFALTYNQYADLVSDPELFKRSFHHFRIASMHDPDNDQILVDWSIALLHYHELVDTSSAIASAETKLLQAAKLGNASAFYTLAHLYAINQAPDRSLYYLEKAHKFNALPSLEEVIDDEWLESLHDQPAFQALVAKLQKLEEKQA